MTKQQRKLVIGRIPRDQFEWLKESGASLFRKTATREAMDDATIDHSEVDIVKANNDLATD